VLSRCWRKLCNLIWFQDTGCGYFARHADTGRSLDMATEATSAANPPVGRTARSCTEASGNQRSAAVLAVRSTSHHQIDGKAVRP